MTDREGHPDSMSGLRQPTILPGLRTKLAVERTIMAWLRTAVSLIGFGFAAVQFFERMRQMPRAAPAGLFGAHSRQSR
jgi:uncharacterized membrane protein YidH (DUF202 family)